MSNKIFRNALMLAIGFGMVGFLAACGGGGGGSSSGSSSSSSTTATNEPTLSDSAKTDFGGDKGTATAADAYTTSEKVSIVQAQSTGGASLKQENGFFAVDFQRAAGDFSALDAITPSTFANANPDSDFADDYANQDVYVHERSSEAFGTVNEILCMFGLTRYGKMTNQGYYKAQIDANKCSQERDSASQGGGQSSANKTSGSKGGSSTSYETWKVLSYKKSSSATDPQVVAAWIPMEEEFGDGNSQDMTIFARVKITADKSTKPPYGLFVMNFAAYINDSNGDPTDTIFFKGFLQTNEDSTTGDVNLEWGMKGGNDTPIDMNGVQAYMKMEELAALKQDRTNGTGAGVVGFTRGMTDADGNLLYDDGQGNITTVSTNNHPMGEDGMFMFSFDQNEFIRSKATLNSDRTATAQGTSVCLDRSSYETTAWRYALYHTGHQSTAAGTVVDINSGFPIYWTDSNNQKQYGFLGYWGVWLNGQSPSTLDGATVYKQEFGNGTTTTETPYTLEVHNGKLIKHSKVIASLSDLKGVPLSYSQCDNTSYTCNEYRVIWKEDGDDPGVNKFIIDAQMDQQQWQWDESCAQCDGNTEIDLSALEWTELYFWSQSIGGSIQVKLDPKDDGVRACKEGNAIGTLATALPSLSYTQYSDLQGQNMNITGHGITANDINSSPWGSIELKVANDTSGDEMVSVTAYVDDNNLTIVRDYWWYFWDDQNFTGTAPEHPIGTEVSELSWDQMAFDCSSIYTSATARSAAEVVIFKESFVQKAADAPASGTLNCLSDCPKGSAMDNLTDGTTGNDDRWSVYWDTSSLEFQQAEPVDTDSDSSNDASYITYSFSTTGTNAMLLVDQNQTAGDTSDDNPIAITSSSLDSGTEFQWGLWTGPMFEDSQKSNLACDWDSSANTTCGWQAWSSLDTYYTWETGPESWSKVIVVKDENGDEVTFDPPMQVKYTHAQTNTSAFDYKYDGASFFLEYNGYGDLWGVPGHCVDEQDNEVSCDGADGFVRWVSDFSIPDGAEVTDTSDNTTTYYVLALEKEERMAGKNSCTIDFSTYGADALVMPDPSASTFTWENPRTGGTTHNGIGNPPDLTGAPAVLDGKVQVTIQ